MKRLLMAALLCLSPLVAFGQYRIDAGAGYSITAENSRPLGDLFFVETDSIEIVPTLRISLTTPADLPEDAAVKFKCTNTQRVRVPFAEHGFVVDDTGKVFSITVTQPGKVWVEAKVKYLNFDEKKHIDEELFIDGFDFDIEPPDDPVDPDDPPDPDPPPIPNDQFDNLGAKVYTWSQGLANRREVAIIFANAGESLLTDRQATINGVSASLRAKLSAYPEYQTLRDKINVERNKFWSAGLTTIEIASFYKAIAAGLSR